AGLVAGVTAPIAPARLKPSRFRVERTAIGGLFSQAAHDLRRQQPAQIAGSARRDLVDIDAAHRAFLELDLVAGSDQARGELPDGWLMSDEPDAGLARMFFEVDDHCGIGPVGSQRLD